MKREMKSRYCNTAAEKSSKGEWRRVRRFFAAKSMKNMKEGWRRSAATFAWRSGPTVRSQRIGMAPGMAVSKVANDKPAVFASCAR